MRRRWTMVVVGALAACARPAETTPIREPGAAEPVAKTTSAPEDDGPAATHALPQARAIIDAAKLEKRYIGHAELEALAAAGLTPQLAMAAVQEAANECVATECKASGTHAADLHVRALVGIVGRTGQPGVLPALIVLDAHGYYATGAIEEILQRQMQREAGRCAPPSSEEIEAARGRLADFVVVDVRGDKLRPRPPTEAELDDLAYFYAGVDDSLAEVGRLAARGGPAPTQDPVDVGQRARELERLGNALERGDLSSAREAAVTYLATLGYPGPLDVGREADRTWGGARFSYVMRDLALVSEVVGELSVASDLYLRADPGGGMCGTSVDYRRGNQLRGLIRTHERVDGCRAVVAHRLLDWDHEYDPGEKAEMGYGPGRLASAGWDLPRMYRGALLTRNRADPRTHGLTGPGAARRAREGDEHWEWRVRAAEGLADVAGPDALDELAALLSVADASLRARILSAIGRAAQRYIAGPCPDNVGWYGGYGGSNVWYRQVSTFATTCREQLTDTEAEALAAKLLPYAKDPVADVRHEAIETLGRLAPPSYGKRLKRWRKQGQAAERRACKDLDEWSQTCADAQGLRQAADAGFEVWSSAIDRAKD